MDSGLHLATSEAFWGEDCGWFRITFAVPRKVLELGLNRYFPPRRTGLMIGWWKRLVQSRRVFRMALGGLNWLSRPWSIEYKY
jgi:hypothetical protein